MSETRITSTRGNHFYEHASAAIDTNDNQNDSDTNLCYADSCENRRALSFVCIESRSLRRRRLRSSKRKSFPNICHSEQAFAQVRKKKLNEPQLINRTQWTLNHVSISRYKRNSGCAATSRSPSVSVQR